MGRLVALAVVVLAATALAVGAASSQPPPSQPFVTGVFDPLVFGHPGREQGFTATKAAGGTVVRLLVQWRDVAPDTKDKPPGFNARNPIDPLYDWDEVDGEVQRAVAAGLQPILDIFDAPAWATQGRYTQLDLGPIYPDPGAFGDFAYATALRYGGGTLDLPRVSSFQAWNEPNLGLFLFPSRVDGKDVSPDWYRSMLNSFAAAVHSVHADNVVVAGALAPFSSDVDYSVPPLRFMRELLCLSDTLTPTCSNTVSFEAWSHHPYTSGGPNHHAAAADDASLGDLPKIRAILDAAQRAGHIQSSTGRAAFWVTEFSWDSNPPDPEGVPDATLTRWVSEAFYRMWASGVSLITWFTIKDNPFPESYYQSGLYRIDWTPKPMVAAFKFPFVAFKVAKGSFVWGRTPDGKTATVTIERKSGSRWLKVSTLKASSVGIFTQTFTKLKPAPKTTDVYRARIGSVAAVPFSLAPTRDLVVKPFGVYGPL